MFVLKETSCIPDVPSSSLTPSPKSTRGTLARDAGAALFPNSLFKKYYSGSPLKWNTDRKAPTEKTFYLNFPWLFHWVVPLQVFHGCVRRADLKENFMDSTLRKAAWLIHSWIVKDVYPSCQILQSMGNSSHHIRWLN